MTIGITIAQQRVGNKYLFTPTRFKDYDLDISDRRRGGSQPGRYTRTIIAGRRHNVAVLHSFGLQNVNKIQFNSNTYIE